MNKEISKLIVDNYYEFIYPILNNKFALDKKINVELEDGEKFEKPLYGTEGVFSDSKFSLLACDISSEDGVHEWISVFKLNDLTPYALESSVTSKKLFIFYSKRWAQISPLLQSKFLAGIELLKENIVDYKKPTNYDDLYQALISYLNYEEIDN